MDQKREEEKEEVIRQAGVESGMLKAAGLGKKLKSMAYKVKEKAKDIAGFETDEEKRKRIRNQALKTLGKGTMLGAGIGAAVPVVGGAVKNRSLKNMPADVKDGRASALGAGIGAYGGYYAGTGKAMYDAHKAMKDTKLRRKEKKKKKSK